MSKTNTAVYLYDHLMIIAIALAVTVFTVFNHVKNKKYVKIFQKERGNVQVSEGETVKRKERLVLFIDSRRRLFWNQIAK